MPFRQNVPTLDRDAEVTIAAERWLRQRMSAVVTAASPGYVIVECRNSLPVGARVTVGWGRRRVKGAVDDCERQGMAYVVGIALDELLP